MVMNIAMISKKGPIKRALFYTPITSPNGFCKK